MKKRMCTVVMILAVALIAGAPLMAGSAIVGSVAGSMNATIGGQALVPNTTVFSGDSLQVREGAAVVAVGRGSRLVFGRATEASFLREGTDVTVLLGQGNVSLYQGQAGVSLRVKVGTVTVAPTGGFKTLGEVAMVNGAVVVTAKEGKLRVEGNGPAVEVVKGKTITLQARGARAPQPQGGGAGVGGSTALQVASVGASGVSAVMGGIAISRAGDARDAAAAANSTAANAVDAANDATAAAEAAGEAANAAGCALDTIVPDVDGASPYVPPAGFSCP